jgi:hypothetical protein
MTRSNTSVAASEQDPDHSRPYRYRAGELKEIPFYDAGGNTATGPAGTINSCVADLARWLAVHLEGGRAGETQLVSAHNLAEMHKPHMFVDDPLARERLGLEFNSYGLGWSLYSYKGQVVVEHSGGIDGFCSRVALLPRHRLGVAVLTNGDGYHNAIADLLPLTIYDRLAGLEPTDWNETYRQMQDEFEQGEAQSKEQAAAQRRAAPPSHPLDDYLGDYEHPAYGVYTVRRAGEGLELVANDKLVLPMEHHHYDVFATRLEQWDTPFQVHFSLDLRGNVAGFAVQLEPMVKDIVFTRRPDRRLSDPAFLAHFVGEYEVMGITVPIVLRQGHLVAAIPSGEYELVPYQGTEFTLKGLTGRSMAFRADARGVYREMVWTIPGAVYTARRKGRKPRKSR